MRQIALLPHDVRYAMWARHCTKSGADSTVGMPRGPRQLQALEKLEIIAPRQPRRGRRGTNKAEGAPAKTTGRGPARVIVDAGDDDADDDDDLEL